jgi:Lamin Tail Domain
MIMKPGIFYTLSLLVVLSSCRSKIDFNPPIILPVVNTTDLLISEVSTAINTDPLASGARSHYVELYNGTGASVDLSNYAIGYVAVTDISTLTNWSFPSATFFITFKRTLPNGKCYVIASPQSDPVVIKSDTTWGTTSTLAANAGQPLQLSGNSALALLKKDAAGTFNLGGTNYRIIDVFCSPLVVRVNSTGATSTRNNIIWSIAGESADTRNRTFWRKISIINPTTDGALSNGTTASDSQWKISGDRAWDYTNVGLPSL